MKNDKVLSYFLFVLLCLVYFISGYILGFYQGNISAYKEKSYQINKFFDGKI